MSELDNLYQEFKQTLTPEQRLILAAGGQLTTNLTPEQMAILEKMEPFLEGLTPEQRYARGMQDEIREQYEAGWKAADAIIRPREIKFLIVAVIIGLILGLLIVLGR